MKLAKNIVFANFSETYTVPAVLMNNSKKNDVSSRGNLNRDKSHVFVKPIFTFYKNL